MLVLTRKKDDGFMIGEDIKVTVVDVTKDRVRIGIEAPAHIKIVRNELYDTERFNIQAAVNKPASSVFSNLLAGKNKINKKS